MKRKYKYMTNCEIGLKRQADHKKLRDLRLKFVGARRVQIDGNENLANHIAIDPKTKKAKVLKDWAFLDESKIPLYEAIPSALALYRLCAFNKVKVQAKGQKGYICIWSAGLVHVPSRRLIFFGEYKGAFSFWTSNPSEELKDKAFMKDLLEFLTYLVSRNFAHPCGGLVAGSVA